MSHLFGVLPDEYNQVGVSCNVNISQAQFKDLKEKIRLLWKTELNRRNTKEKEEPEDNVLALNAGEKKYKNNNSKFFKDECNKCGKHGHRASYCWGNKN